MKKLFLTVVMLGVATLSYAQGYMFVNSETVFRSIPAYNQAIQQLDDLGAQYQRNVESAFAAIEEMYNNYQAQRPYLSESARATREENIITREREATRYQEDIFGPNGQLMQKRIELLKPIQDRVFSTINAYAERNGFTMVIDLSTNPNILFSAPGLNRTDDIVNLLK